MPVILAEELKVFGPRHVRDVLWIPRFYKQKGGNRRSFQKIALQYVH
jgi:hypothetical protein